MWVCSHFLFTGDVGQRLVSPFVAFEVANVVNYIVSSKLVFGDRAVEPGKRGLLKRFITYNLSYSISFLLSLGLLQLLMWITPWDVVVCNLIAISLAGILNFTINTRVTFKNRLPRQKA